MAEIEQAALERVWAIGGPRRAEPAYAEGLRAAVSAALEYALAAIARGSERPAPVPLELRAQARLAARSGVGLDTVLRRYCAGSALLGDHLIEAAEEAELPAAELKRFLRAQAAGLERLLAAVSEEYRREAQAGPLSAKQLRAEWVKRLLDGELLDASQLAYELDAWHLGVVLLGAGAQVEIRELARSLDRRLLLVPRGEDGAWAWLGGARPLDPTELARQAAARLPDGARLAIGEPAEGVAGWRLTHRQAAAAAPIALRGHEPLVRYADVALLASAAQDDLLLASLRRLYLEPLERERDGGAATRETLRAYFAAGRNVSSTAAALGISRQAVGSRLRAIEERTGRPLGACAAEIEIALRIEAQGPAGK
jgi:hypothetical protein